MAHLNLLTSGEVGNISNNHFKFIREQTEAKWESLGFLEGLRGYQKENLAQLFENQANQLLKETDTASSGSFETVVFPIVRRVFSKLLANDIVSVQAMNMPIGKMFFYVPQTSERNSDGTHSGLGGMSKGRKTAIGLPECVQGSNCKLTEMMKKNIYDVYYNDGLFDNSKGAFRLKSGGYTVVTLDKNGEYSTPTATDALPTATDGSLRNIMLAVTGFTTAGAGHLIGADGNPMDSETFLASLKIITQKDIKDRDNILIAASGTEVPFRLVTQKYGKGIVNYRDVVDNNGSLYVEVDLRHPVDPTGTSTYDGYVGAGLVAPATKFTSNDFSFAPSWTEYESLELESNMGEVSFRLDQVSVDVTERKLRATWSPELAQDVAAFHSIDAEAELTANLSEQIAAEIDREILKDLRVGASIQARWDYNGWRKASTSAIPYTQKDWNQTLITRANQVSAQIHKGTLKGGANFVVVSSEVSAIFDDLEYFHVSDANPEQDQYNMGIERIGSLAGRYQVYRDPYSPFYSIIIGHKGKSLLDTGYIYAPYVPLQLTNTLTNPFNFGLVKGIMTRYAKKLVNNRFYGHIRVDNVQTFNLNELR